MLWPFLNFFFFLFEVVDSRRRSVRAFLSSPELFGESLLPWGILAVNPLLLGISGEREFSCDCQQTPRWVWGEDSGGPRPPRVTPRSGRNDGETSSNLVSESSPSRTWKGISTDNLGSWGAQGLDDIGQLLSLVFCTAVGGRVPPPVGFEALAEFIC